MMMKKNTNTNTTTTTTAAAATTTTTTTATSKSMRTQNNYLTSIRKECGGQGLWGHVSEMLLVAGTVFWSSAIEEILAKELSR